MTAYISICSGIEAATVAWHPLGWEPFAFSEIEAFPCAVLKHHYPRVPNLGDMTKFKDWPDAAINVLVGGTPCQSFSVAGLRQGMADPRGNLALVYLAIADRYCPEWLIWENVPGVLSVDEGRAFGSIIGGMVELGYCPAWRVLDAQYVRVDGFGRAVPQRRRRVFVVGHLGDWRRAAAVLFEPESLSWDSPPRREAGKGIAPTIASRPTGGGGLGTDFDCDGGLVAHTLNAKGGAGRIDGESETFVAHALRADGFDASEDGTGRGTPLVPVAFSCKDHGADAGEIAPTLRSMGHDGSHANAGGQVAVAFTQNQAGDVLAGDVMHCLGTNQNATGRNAINVAYGWAVRRLTPLECERLQGFPDGYTDVPYRNRNWTPDGPRYKALGNSMAGNCMRWLGRRIERVSLSLQMRGLDKHDG